MSPQELEKVPIRFEKLMSQLEERVMSDIVRRIKINAEITSSADWQINRLVELGKSKEEIRKYLKEALDLSNKEIDQLYDEVLEKEYVRNKDVYKLKGKDFIPFAQNDELRQLIGATLIQTKDQLKNITQSTGFIKIEGGKKVNIPLTQFYQDTLDNAIMDIATGTFDYNTVLKRVVNEMTNSGLRTIDYASGRAYRVESAVRTAVMTGISQITGHISEQNAKDLGTEYFEVTAHGTARPSHQLWQGRVYDMKGLIEICGYKTVTGLKGANCRHDFYPFFPEIDERTYTDEELEEWAKRENTPKAYRDKEYTSYEASQKQRKMELLMRKQRQDIKLLKEGGANENDVISAQARYRATMSEYVEFSKTMDLPQQMARVYGDGLKNIDNGGKLKNNIKNDIILTKDEEYALKSYISSESYKINEKLRDNVELSETDKILVKNLDSSLDKMPNFNGLLSRSLKLDDEQLEEFLKTHKVNSEVTYKAYTSMTSAKRYNSYSNIEEYVYSTKAKDISEYNSEEQEKLYKRNSRFKIKEIEKIGNTYHILLEEL